MVGLKNDTATSKTAWWFLTKLNILLPNDPAITLLGINPKKFKTYIHRKSACVCLEHLDSELSQLESKQDVLQQVNGYINVHPDNGILIGARK